MAQKLIDFDTVRQLSADLPGTEEVTVHGGPCIKAYGQLMAWLPVRKKLEAGTLAVRVALEDRAELIEAAPDIYYVTDHYLDYPAVLVRMSRIQFDALKDLLLMAHSFVVKKSAARKRKVSRKAT